MWLYGTLTSDAVHLSERALISLFEMRLGCCLLPAAKLRSLTDWDFGGVCSNIKQQRNVRCASICVYRAADSMADGARHSVGNEKKA